MFCEYQFSKYVTEDVNKNLFKDFLWISNQVCYELFDQLLALSVQPTCMVNLRRSVKCDQFCHIFLFGHTLRIHVG